MDEPPVARTARIPTMRAMASLPNRGCTSSSENPDRSPIENSRFSFSSPVRPSLISPSGDPRYPPSRDASAAQVGETAFLDVELASFRRPRSMRKTHRQPNPGMSLVALLLILKRAAEHE